MLDTAADVLDVTTSHVRRCRHAVINLYRSCRARVRPWDEVSEEGVHFSVRLTELVNSGVRPQLPTDVVAAPQGYLELMELCWSGRPERRPAFTAVQTLLREINTREKRA